MANMSTYRLVTIVDLKLIHDVGGTATADIDLSFANNVDFKTDITTITYEGDGQQAKKYFSTAFDADIEADDWDALGLETVFGKTTVTAGLPAGVAKRTYWGANADSAGVVCGLQVDVTAEDLATGDNKTLRITCPKGTFSPPNPPAVKNVAKAGLKASFSAKKTTTDIAGDTLPSVPADGCFWYLEELS